MNPRIRHIPNIDDLPRRRLFNQEEMLAELDRVSSPEEYNSGQLQSTGNGRTMLDISQSRPAIRVSYSQASTSSTSDAPLNTLGFPQATSTPTSSDSESESQESASSILSERSAHSSSSLNTSAGSISVGSSAPSAVTLRMLYMQNKKLEAQLKKKNEELQDIKRNMRCAAANSGSKRVAVPRECSQAVREVYGKLYKDGTGGFNLSLTKTCQENELVVSTIVREVRSLHGREKWTCDQVRKAAKTYFSSLRDRKRRVDGGTYERHAKAAKKRSRKFRKLQRRQSAMRNSDLSEDMKRQLNEVMTIDFMSSEESMSEDEEEGASRNKTRRLLKLPWERSKLTSLKHKLDSQFAKTAPPVVSRLLPEFVISNVPSSRPPPASAPSWAVRPLN